MVAFRVNVASWSMLKLIVHGILAGTCPAKMEEHAWKVTHRTMSQELLIVCAVQGIKENIVKTLIVRGILACTCPATMEEHAGKLKHHTMSQELLTARALNGLKENTVTMTLVRTYS
ncbi:hypothetical protein HOLleu_37714 [Holothuria leucospilota]|uniref:Uncharacterized protein n=1 Tax=Holothuria leucospilota TaxID=206669 RepID=A0A9Q1BCJ3_HOLLE|nr:hypothetical protein HOLleu_37714 [Holothuria leucospilota]